MTVNTTPRQFTFLGVVLTALVPATSEDWDNVTQPGDCVDTAIDNHGYRGYAGPVRSAITSALEAAGHARKTKTVNDKEVTEGDKDFVARLVSTGAISASELQSLGSAAVEAKNVTFVSTMGTSSRAAVGKKYLDQAQELIGKWERGDKNADGSTCSAERSLGIIKQFVPNASLDDPTNVDAVAMLLRDLEKARSMPA